MRTAMRLLLLGLLCCGGQQNGGDGGADAPSDQLSGLDVISSGCTNGSSHSYAVDASACVAQLASSYSCNGSICSWTAVIPCDATDAGDAGDAGDASDDAGFDCTSACAATKPQGVTSPAGFCQPFAQDGGITISCGGCGV